MLRRAISGRKQLLVLAAISVAALLLAGCNASSSVPTPDDENEPDPYQLKITLLGTEFEVAVSSEGAILSDTQLSSQDGRVALSIDKGTALLDSSQEPVQSMQVLASPVPPAPPENAVIIGPAYSFLPEGITFDSSIRLTLSYDPAEIPQGTKEGDIYIARFSDGGWEKISYKQMDTDEHKLSTLITSSSGYAVLAPVEPEEPQVTPEPSPTPQANRVDLVYFHRTNRCYSCQYAESGIEYTLETYFTEELNDGIITFQSVDVQDSDNAAIVEQYGAYTSQLFINTVVDNEGHIEHIEEIWSYIGDDDGFTLFIKNKINESLEAIS
ncbi:MAG: nitrophenyl compound nitroreductase subunit ArsF family protein [Dehalococcoidales bacterium]